MVATTTPAAASTAATSASRWHRIAGPIATIGSLGALTLALHLRDPHSSGSWGYCPSASLGIYCPGCGGLRAVNDLTNGDFFGAASSNLLFIALLPILVFLLGRWAVERWLGRTRNPNPRLTAKFMTVVGVLAIAFTIARNLPGSWLAP